MVVGAAGGFFEAVAAVAAIEARGRDEAAVLGEVADDKALGGEVVDKAVDTAALGRATKRGSAAATSRDKTRVTAKARERRKFKKKRDTKRGPERQIEEKSALTNKT